MLCRLANVLTSEQAGGRDNTVFVLDGASYHKSKETKLKIKNLDPKFSFWLLTAMIHHQPSFNLLILKERKSTQMRLQLAKGKIEACL